MWRVASLVWLDRNVVAPRRHVAVSQRMVAEDRARYHGQRFAVVQVVDGDTLHLGVPDGGERSTKVRLLGIDAPELAHNGRPEMCFAKEAAAYARQVANNAMVTVYLNETGPTRGKYGRLLAYIECPDGQFLNERLISEGYAYADSRFPHGYLRRYRQLESSARALAKGLWATVTPEQLPAWHRHARASQATE